MSGHQAPPPRTKQPYIKPQLIRWGSLKELTLGGNGTDRKDAPGPGPKTKFGN